RDYARQAREESAAQSAANPQDGQLRTLHAVLLAYLGETEAAVREAEAGARITVEMAGAVAYNALYEQFQVVRVYLVLGRNDEALSLLEKLRGSRYPSKAYLLYDPIFEPLRSMPRFQALLK